MLMIRGDFTRFNAVYFIRSKKEVSRYFRQLLGYYRFTGVPCLVETIRIDDTAEFKSGAFADLCWERCIRQEFTAADGPQCNGVAERGIAMIESAGKAATIQAGLNFPGMGIPFGDSLWAAQAYWACHAGLNFPGMGIPFGNSLWAAQILLGVPCAQLNRNNQ